MASLRSTRITAKRVQKVFYSDFDRDFDLNPITGALEVLVNDKSIQQSIENLVLTQRGERFYHLQVGSDVQKSLFDNFDDLTAVNIQNSIKQTINQYEPRATNVQIALAPTTDFNGYLVNITFTPINIPTQTQTFDLLIPRIR